jgi:hypothetical protein
VIKTKSDDNSNVLMICRYPLKASKDWIEANENEITQWNEETLDRQIIWKKTLDRKITLADGLTIAI